MSISRTLLGLALFGASALVQAAPNCTLKLNSDDRMQFDRKTATVSAACKTITLDLTHTGKLPANVMGHNIVVSATSNVAAVSSAGMKAGAAAHYLPKADARVLGATKLIGGGAKVTATFPGGKLKAGGDYTFYCSFPGHAGIMKGKLVVTK